MKIRTDEMVARGFRSSIRRIRRVWRCLRESSVSRAEGTENLIGGHMMKTRMLDWNGLIHQPGLAGGIEQNKRSDDIRLDKLTGGMNRAVDMRFRGKMDNRVDLMLMQHAIH